MNLKHLFASLLVILSITPLHAQDKLSVDLNRIQVNVTMNPDHYRQLLARFIEGDTTMRLDQTATAYYGYSFSFDYNPSEDYGEITGTFNRHDYKTAIPMILEALESDPFSLDLTVMGLISAEKINDSATASLLQRRLDMTVDVILSSGSGITPESPFVVISDRDIYRILKNILGAGEIIGHSKIGDIDAWKIKFPGNEREHILYFNNCRQEQFETQQ